MEITSKNHFDLKSKKVKKSSLESLNKLTKKLLENLASQKLRLVSYIKPYDQKILFQKKLKLLEI